MMIAKYYMVSKEELKALKKADEMNLNDEVSEMDKRNEFLNLGRIFDALHCLLTGEGTDNPIVGNRLSEAILGIYNFSEEEDADFVAYSKNRKLGKIVNALESVDFEATAEDFDLKKLKKKKIDPKGIWKEEKSVLIDEMRNAFLDLLLFYRKALTEGKHIVVTIMKPYVRSEVLGPIYQKKKFPVLWVRNEVQIYYFNMEIKVIYEFDQVVDKRFIKDADKAMRNFLQMNSDDRLKASEQVYKNCMDFLGSVEPLDTDEPLRRMRNVHGIWDFVYPNHIHVKRNPDDFQVVVTVACLCEWEDEHGLQLVYKNGKELVKVSAQE